MQTISRLTSGREILAATGDPWTRSVVAPAWSGPAWAAPGAVAYGTGSPEEPEGWITVVGEPAPAGELVRLLLENRGEPPYGVTVPRGTAPAGGMLDGTAEEWELMTVDAAPPAQPGEADVVPLEAGSHAAIAALLAAASPEHSVRPGNPEVVRWAGVRGADGALAAVGALLDRAGTQVPYVASIATAPSRRGQGLGAAVTGWLTRHALESGAGWCTLAVHSGNGAAKRVYHRLGYRTVQEFTSIDLDCW